MSNPNNVIGVSISAPNISDADAFGEFIAAATREAGFKNVSIDTAGQKDYSDTGRAVAAMRAINPELFNSHVQITTEQIDNSPGGDVDDIDNL